MHTYPAVIYISKALVLQNYLTTCCTAGDSETKTERANTFNTRSKRKTPTNPKATMRALLPPERLKLTIGTNRSTDLKCVCYHSDCTVIFLLKGYFVTCFYLNYFNKPCTVWYYLLVKVFKNLIKT